MKVLFEGPPDETLIKSLGVKATKDGRHKSGVLKELTQGEELMGIVDEDPKNTQSRPKAMNKFHLAEEKHTIKVYRHQSNNNQLIVLCPDLENWILKAIKASKVDVSKFNLPSKANALHGIINSRLPNFEKLIHELITKENSAILYLQSLLTKRE